VVGPNRVCAAIFAAHQQPQRHQCEQAMRQANGEIIDHVQTPIGQENSFAA
jgi:hypothetical protein